MRRTALIWKIPLAVFGVLVGIVLLLLIAATSIICSPKARKAVLEKGIEIANEKTEYDINLGRLYLSPFYHSPLVLYRAYKGEDDLPLQIEIDSLYVGHCEQDTLACIHALRLDAILKTGNGKGISDFLSLPIVVNQLYLDQTTFHSDSLIATVGVDAIVGNLDVASPTILIAEGKFPLYNLRLRDVFVGIDLRGTKTDSIPKDTAATKMAFDIQNAELNNIYFRLTPLDLNIQTGSLATDAMIDVGANCYDAKRIDVGRFLLSLHNLRIPADTIYGNACADIKNNLITSNGLHVSSKEIGARADLSATTMDLNTMQVSVNGDAEFQGSQAHLRASYDIKNEAYNAKVHINRVNLAPILKDNKTIILAGDIEAIGQGFNLRSKAMTSSVKAHLTDAVYDNIDVSGLQLNAVLANNTVDGTLHLPFDIDRNNLKARAQTEHKFHVARFMTPEKMSVDYHTQMRSVHAQLADKKINADTLRLDFSTDTTTALDFSVPNLQLTAQSPMHVLQLVNQVQPLIRTVSDSSFLHAITSLSDLTMLDTLRQQIPDLRTDIHLAKGSPLQQFIDSTGLDLDKVVLSLTSDSVQTLLSLDATTNQLPAKTDNTSLHKKGTGKLYNMPQINAVLHVAMTEGKTDASINADTHLTDGAMNFYGICTDAALRFHLNREQNSLYGEGKVILDSLSYHNIDLGNRYADIAISPSSLYNNAIKADIQMNDMPITIIENIIKISDLDISGMVRAKASVDGLPAKVDISANVLPLGVAAQYKPYGVGLSMGETPIVMEHNHIDLNGLPIYGADSTFIALSGGLDLDSMRLDVVLAADSFAPVKLVKDGPIPVYGDLATDIRGKVTGALNNIVADVDITILPTTDITYPIDKKNLAQVKPHGTVNVRYAVADKEPLNLGGRINVDDGMVRYSPKAYPVIPFHVDSGSHIAFNGPIGKTQLNVSASQKVKADIESKDASVRRVDFNTGVRLNGKLDSIGIKSIGFFLEAPDDEAITHELASLDESTREGLAAVLLTTGMYLGESNEAAQRDNYALSSIINSRINATIANSKMGKFMDVDFSSGKKNDMNITLSKSFFKDKLRITIGSTISDNPETNGTKGLLSNITADYKLNKTGNVLLRLYSIRDNNNVLEGELYKSGLGVRAIKEWQHHQLYRGDSILRIYDLTADAGVAYRSNNSIGPDVTLKSSIKNLLGKGETFTLKGDGAYYWAMRNRHPGDPKKTDTYKLGVNASLLFPYLHWGGDNNPEGDTRYMLGYQYENIAGGYGVHNIFGSFTYFFHSSRYITHAFTPFSLSVVMMKAESDDLFDKAAEYPQLIKVIAGNEFVPSIGYNFVYNDYRSKRAVNTMLDLGIKESGNIINALYCAFKHSWDEKNKKIGVATFNQFVKLTAELRNKFNLTDQVSIATRLYAGANIPLGNSNFAPLSEAFYAGGPNSMRSASPYAYGPGNFYSTKYNQNFFHAGDVKLEANLELRFPIVWKIYGATFVDAGNVWNWYSTADIYKTAGYEDYLTRFEIPNDVQDGIFGNPDFARQIALGTGIGLRLDLDGLVVRLDLGVGIHAPYQTYKYDKDGKPDKSQPIYNYYNIPSALDALRVNFGIGYPF
ncbi:MAG: BamA/TamA family outer membrane protein [Paludibacteraceae bacterium]|nr:BamA/TamA family outer membrane protein [Paludibacteraceae bacterium]